MKLIEWLKKIVEYEKKVEGIEFGSQVLVIAIILAVIVTKYRSGVETRQYKEQMDSYVTEYLDDNILILPEDIPSSNAVVMTGEVLASSMEEYDIDLIVAGDYYVTKDGRPITIVKYGNVENPQTRYFLSTESCNIKDIISKVIVPTLSEEEIAKEYNLVLSTDFMQKILNLLDDQKKETQKLILKKE